MRVGGGFAVQQTLTSEAASVLKHSLSLARRRGHAQVTPLHVASTLLITSRQASLLRRACLKSQPHPISHPLQCRALELCFNVALNRLPTTPPTGGPLSPMPSLSNALIAALKRAQAHQRRGCIEQQQQQQPHLSLLTVKVELEQLIISILDDPSVSRVMREAGFSSTAVKNNLEEDSSSASSVFQCYNTSNSINGGGGGVYSTPCSPSPTETHPSANFWQTHFLNYSSEQNPFLFSSQKKYHHPSTYNLDLKVVLEVFLRNNKKRKNTVIVGDSVSINEGVVSELMGRVERGEVPEELKSTQFIKFQFAPVSLKFMRREDVEMKLLELKRKVDSIVSGGGGVIIYAGDLKWTEGIGAAAESNIAGSERQDREREGGGGGGGRGCYGYNPADHLIGEIGRLIYDYSSNSSSSSSKSNNKVWLMATASYQTYMKCQMKQPPLEIQWGLQPVSVPSGGLGLSLHASSTIVHDPKMSFSSENPSQVLETKPFISIANAKEEQQDYKLNCCPECNTNYEKEAAFLRSSGQQKLLPSWLHSNGSGSGPKDQLVELRRKWNRLCQSLHYGRTNQNQNNHFNSSSSVYNSIGKAHSYVSSYPWWPNQQSSVFPSESNSTISFIDSPLKQPHHNSNNFPRFRRQQSCFFEFSFGNETNKPDTEVIMEPRLDSLKNSIDQDKEVKITLELGNSLSYGSGTMPAQRRGRMIHGRGDMSKMLEENVPWQSESIPSIVEALVDSEKSTNKKTWFLIQGKDFVGKRRLASAIAEAVFGSVDFLFHMSMRKNDNGATPPCSEVLAGALSNREKLVVLIEDVDYSDTQFIKFLADGFESGKYGESSSKNEVTHGQAIFILTTGSYYEDEKINQNFVIQMKLHAKEDANSSSMTLKLDHRKRTAELDLSNNSKKPRIEEKKDFSRQSSFSTLDLNLKAEEDCSDGEDNSPISSDLTREMGTDSKNPHDGFLESIENRFVFDLDQARDGRMREIIRSKIKGSFEQVFGRENVRVCIYVEDMVLEEVVGIGSCSFVNSLFEKWLKEVFQTSLETVKNGGENGISFRLCFGGKGDSIMENGYMGSCLPRKIQVSFVD